MKIHLVLEDIFTLKKSEVIVGSSDKIKVPKVKRTEYQFGNIDHEGFVSYINAKGDTFADLRLPNNDLGEELKVQFEIGVDITITVLSAMGQSVIISYTETK